MLLGTGCIAGPTPHPSKTDNSAEFGQDASGGSVDPTPGLEPQDDCESSGGAWDGAECIDGIGGEMDAQMSADASDDTESNSDAVEDDAMVSDSTDVSAFD